MGDWRGKHANSLRLCFGHVSRPKYDDRLPFFVERDTSERPTHNMEDTYYDPAYAEMAKQNAISADRLSTYARELHRNPEVVADLIFAHEVDSSHYSEKEFRHRGSLLSGLMYKISKENMQEPYSWTDDHFCFGDFNRWYLKEVVYGKKAFEDALSLYLQVSPCIKWDAGQ